MKENAHFFIRNSTIDDADVIAQLIFDSTNQWYQQHLNQDIFTCKPVDCRLFFDVYEQLDPSCCLLAVDNHSDSIVGSCFYHPRETHISLGIMNAHPRTAGWGVAKTLLREIIDIAQQQDKPLRLFSSAMNLDSYSLYTKHGFTPYALFQDMIIQVPDTGIQSDMIQTHSVRSATVGDLIQIVELEHEIWGCSRLNDWKYFIENKRGIWHVSVHEDQQGNINGVLASVNHQASNMLGPGIAVSSQIAESLILTELNQHSGQSPVFLVPAADSDLVSSMYAIGARNCELHVGQSLGTPPEIRGVVMPTFMPETC